MTFKPERNLFAVVIRLVARHRTVVGELHPRWGSRRRWPGRQGRPRRARVQVTRKVQPVLPHLGRQSLLRLRKGCCLFGKELSLYVREVPREVCENER